MFVYVTYENDPGSLQGYRVDSIDGVLEAKGSPVSSLGRHPCYAAIDLSDRWLIAGNYSDGESSFCVCPILPDGSLGSPISSVKFPGGDSIDPSLCDRQVYLIYNSSSWSH